MCFEFIDCYNPPEKFQCPHGLELLRWRSAGSSSFTGCFNALSGLYLISTPEFGDQKFTPGFRVNALSGLYLISTTECRVTMTKSHIKDVSMPSRAYTSFLLKEEFSLQAETICVNALSGLYLISTYNRNHVDYSCLGSVNALSGLYLISTPHS